MNEVIADFALRQECHELGRRGQKNAAAFSANRETAPFPESALC